MLNEAGIRVLADVRSVPGSRRHPQFGRAQLTSSLADARHRVRASARSWRTPGRGAGFATRRAQGGRVPRLRGPHVDRRVRGGLRDASWRSRERTRPHSCAPRRSGRSVTVECSPTASRSMGGASCICSDLGRASRMRYGTSRASSTELSHTTAARCRSALERPPRDRWRRARDGQDDARAGAGQVPWLAGHHQGRHQRSARDTVRHGRSRLVASARRRRVRRAVRGGRARPGGGSRDSSSRRTSGAASRTPRCAPSRVSRRRSSSCAASPDPLRRKRFEERAAAGRHRVHIDSAVLDEWNEDDSEYLIDIGTPRLIVDTTDGYAPDLEQVTRFTGSATVVEHG